MTDQRLLQIMEAYLVDARPDDDGRIYIFRGLSHGGIDFWLEPSAVAGERAGFRAEIKGAHHAFIAPAGTSPVRVATEALTGYLGVVRA